MIETHSKNKENISYKEKYLMYKKQCEEQTKHIQKLEFEILALKLGTDLGLNAKLFSENVKLNKFIDILRRTYIQIDLLGDLSIERFNHGVKIGEYATEDEIKLITEVLCNERNSNK